MEEKNTCIAVSKKTNLRCKLLKSNGTDYCGLHNPNRIIKKEKREKKIYQRISESGILCKDYPDLFKEIDIYHEKNPNIDELKTLKINSNKEIYWICLNPDVKCGHHKFKTTIYKRLSRGDSCSFCSSHQTCICDSIYSTHPDICKQFLSEKHKNKFTDFVSNFEVVKSKNGSKIEWETKSFSIHEMIEHNKKFDLKSLRSGSNPLPNIGEIKGCFWVCNNKNNLCNHHIWDANIKTRIDTPGCPFCASPKARICPCDSIVNHPCFVEFDYKNANNPKLEYLKNIASGSNEKIWWKCSSCEYKWETRCAERTKKNNPTGCPKCNKGVLIPIEEILKRLEIFNVDRNFDYREFFDKYQNCKTKGKIYCKRHDKYFYCDYIHHIKRKSGCKECTYEKQRDAQLGNKDEFVSIAFDMWGEIYNYEKFEYISATDPGKIYCNLCKNYFMKSPNNHISNRQGCSNCSKSSGEIEIINQLKKMDIAYKNEVKLDEIPSIEKRRFDFLIDYKDKKILIEFDGIQHFKYFPLFHNRDERIFIQKQQIDILKTKLPINNGYFMIRIYYQDIKNIKFHLEKAFEYFNDLNKVYFTDPSQYSFILESL